ncbi:MAG: ribosome-associated translation inhibitor RaiA [Bacteroidota bacterium]|nr:ribosome-associated translation inhibitor RaiA [Bacteroidota bacterium]
MKVTITARHFKAHETLRTYASDAIQKIERYYTGVVSADMILSYEKPMNSLKIAELHVAVSGTVLKAIGKTDDFVKSIDAAVEKIGIQLLKHKSKQREKKKTVIRLSKEKV